MKYLIITAALFVAFTAAQAQTKPERQYYLPFTKSQLDTLANQINRATYKLQNSDAKSKDVSPAINVMGEIYGAFLSSYQAQEQAAKQDTTKKVKTGGRP